MASATAFQRTFLDFPLRICCSCGRHSAEPTVEPMQIDIAQFHQAFLDESLENLDVMACGLLALDSNDFDLEDVNAIFRAAHSIKGGSATSGCSAIASFTHHLETLRDNLRGGGRIEVAGSRSDWDLVSARSCL